MSGTICKGLDTLACRRAELADVTALIDEIAGDLARQRDALRKECDDLDASIKDSAKYIPPSQAHTLKGRLLQLVWNKGKQSTKNLEALALNMGATTEQVDACKGKGFWSIKMRGK